MLDIKEISVVRPRTPRTPLFVTILSQLTSSEASILNHCCNNCKIKMSRGGWLHSEYISLNSIQLFEITEITDIHRLDRELDHLRALELIEGGFNMSSPHAHISIKTLGIQLYLRCQGFLGTPEEFFQVELEGENSERTRIDPCEERTTILSEG